MHDVLRERVWRRLEALPQEQVYQVLDYIEFLETKYAREKAREPDVLQKFAERVEDSLRMRSVAPAVISGTVGLLGSARRVMRTVSDAGRDILGTTPAPGTRPPASVKPAPASVARGPETVIRQRPITGTRAPETVLRRRPVGDPVEPDTVARPSPAADPQPLRPSDGQEPAADAQPPVTRDGTEPRNEDGTGAADGAAPGSENQEKHGTA